ncbi:MAG: phosphatidylserine decarboxylase [candidate division Zixibacteria bacterium]|nr:phosphatidylserine decarboxylase [candidate division Zixibacteria bacterium]
MIAREGIGLILTFVILSVAALVLAMLFNARWGLIIASILALGSLFLIYFFRDPHREIPTDPKLILAPSDGRVLSIERLDRNDFLNSAARKISVFLSPLDVHVIRMPVSGSVSYSNYQKGSFKSAYRPEASAQNENLELGLVNRQGKIILRQIAGFLARRIVCHARPSDNLDMGSRLGIIKFGSRVELIVSDRVKIQVEPNQRLIGGETVMGEFI